MGVETRATKDRKCNICEESRQRTANELKAHYVKCLAALRAFTNDGGELVNGDFLGSSHYRAIR